MQSFAVQFFLSLILGLNSLTLHAQGITQPSSIPSPNAIGMGMGVTNPVNLYTGTVAVNLPIKNLNERGIALPIILSYDGSGVRPEQHPTWVGQNWNLSAGGSIVRVVNNMPDEANIYHFRFDKNFDSEGASYYSTLKDSVRANYFYNCKDLMLKNISQSALKILADSSSSHYFSYTVFDAYNNSGGKTVWVTGIDYQPDIFMFNFMGFTGQFFLGNDGKWKVSSQQNIKIVFDYNNSSNYDYPFVRYASDGVSHYDKTIFGFKLIDDKGTTYVFGYDANAVEYDMPFFGQNKPASKKNQWVANAWHLTKVVDKFGVEVYNLKYSRGYFVGNFYNADGTAMDGKGDDSDIYSFDGSVVDKNIYLGDLDCSSYKFHVGKVNGRLISPCYLSTIYSQGRAVAEFNRSIANDIRYASDNFITDKSSSRFYYLFNSNSAFRYPNADVNKPLSGLRWYKLNTIKFEDNTTANFVYNDSISATITERLNLIRLEIKGDSKFVNCKTNRYKFNYDKFNQLPGFLSKMVDHWGFYNGHAYVIDKTKLDQFYKERDSNPAFSTIGILKKIEFPTGGFTEYIYEPNTYESIDKHEDCLAGGLRIKKIVQFDGCKTYAKEYRYIKKEKLNETSSGILSFMPIYEKSELYFNGLYHSIAQRVFSINSIIPIVNTDGSHIQYSRVQEVEKDGSYSEYVFSSLSNCKDEAPVTFTTDISIYDLYSSNSLKRGVLLEKVDYDSTGVWVRKTKYKYDTFGRETEHFVYSSYAQKDAGCDSNLGAYYTGGIRKLYYYDYLPVETVTILNDNGKELLLNKINNTYSILNIDNAGSTVLLKATESKTDRGTFRKTILYPTDYLTPSLSPLGRLSELYRIGEPIEIFSTINGVFNGYSKADYIIKNNMPIFYRMYSSPNDKGDLKLETTLDKIDDWGNILQISKRGGSVESFIYGYSNRLPIIKLVDVKYDDFISYLLSKSLTISSLQNQDSTMLENYFKTIRSDFYKTFPKGYILSSIYKPTTGVVKETDARGNSIITEYDCFGFPNLKRDSNKNILSYNETNTINVTKTKPTYYNFAVSKNFYKTNCSNSTGSAVVYRIPSNKYYSGISQNAADSIALKDFSDNGQVFANTQGGCTKPYVKIFYENISFDTADILVRFYSDPNFKIPTYVNNLRVEYAKTTYEDYRNSTTENCYLYCSGTSTIIMHNALISDKMLDGDLFKPKSMKFSLNPSVNYYYNEGFWNHYFDKSFTKTDCSDNNAGTSVIYEVPAGTYFSNISQEDANAAAWNDINKNGQNYANIVGACKRYGNAQLRRAFYKNDCQSDEVGSAVEYTVNAGRYFSTISQEDADIKAQVDVDQKGQNYANTNGFCYYLKLNSSSLNYSIDGGNLNLNVTSNTSYTISSDSPWITVSTASSSGNRGLTLTCTSNTGGPRTGYVTIKSTGLNGTMIKTVTINQNGSFIFQVNPSSITFNEMGGSQIVSVNSSSPWSIKSISASYITAIIDDNNQLRITCLKYLMGIRRGSVTITNGKTDVMINIHQGYEIENLF